jgi:FKBP-type peptidyl-prolyl cis-trans isomerase
LGETFADDQDVLAFDDNDTADAITGTFDATTGTLTLSGDGTADEYQAALRAITFDNTSENPDETQRRATITLARENGDALTATRDITVVAIDDDPVVEQASSTININLDEDPTLPVSIGIDELTTPNTGTTQLSAAVVVIDDGFVPGDVLGFTEVDGITGDYNPETGVLSLTGSADVTDYQSVLSSVTFDFDQSAASGQRRISYEATDVTGTFIVDELLVNVITNASVVLQTSDNVLPFFTEGGAPINVDTGLTIAAADDATVNEALVAITSGFSSGDDFLSFDRRLAIEEDINGSYDFETGELTFSGDASAETYQRLLRTVTYHSIDQTIPESGTRDIQYSIISDGDFSVRRTATVTPRTEAQRTEPIADRDERLIQQFIAANNLTTQTTASGLHYIVETEGNGQFPEATDDIVATYTGRYLNGVKFDNGTDVPFNLSGVIEGWTEGFQFFSPGGTGQLLIPSALAYGALGTSGGAGIPPNTVIQFDVEFVSNVTQDSA